MKTLQTIIGNDHGHWVGDGFPVRSLFSYNGDTDEISPFLLFDYAGPYQFDPNGGQPRGVGQHPHRGFETVTIVYDGEVSHKDSSGGGGTIGTGDVQWMTAASGVIHEEFHSARFSEEGGPFRMVQLWVNLPAADKMSAPRYQAITTDTIPTAPLDGGTARIIAGELNGVKGPASTHTPINMWDVRLDAGASVTLPVPDGHNTMIAVLEGDVRVNDTVIAPARIAKLSVDGEGVAIRADSAAMILVLTGVPIDEPVVGHGPFVMNTEAEIVQAYDDFRHGRFGAVAA